MNDELVARVEREVLTWSGVEKEPARFNWSGAGTEPGRINVTIFKVGRRQIGHIHHEGVADLQFPKAVHDELVAAGKAYPHAAGFAAVVSHDLRQR